MRKFKSFHWVICLMPMALSLNGCLRAADPKAKLNSSLDSSFSCDLKSSGEASKSASDASFQCAYKAIGQVANLATGSELAQSVKYLIDTTNRVQSIIAGSSKMIDAMNNYYNSGTVSMDGLDGAADVADNASKLDPAVSKSPIVQCLGGNYNVFKKYLNVTSRIQSLHFDSTISSGDLLKIMAISSEMADIVYSNVTASTQGVITSMAGCVEWFDQNPEFKKSMQDSVDAMKEALQPIEIFRTLANCGVSLSVGGYVLANNSACLVEDIQNYYQGKAALEKQKDDFIHTSTSSEEGCMMKYGMWLWKQNLYRYATRVGACSDLCATANGKKLYYENGRSIFPVDSDYDFCTMNAHVGGTSVGVELCASYCCGQNGSACQEAALKKAGFK